MGFSIFINFDGNCREALDFYAKTFKSEVEGLMTFDQMPSDPTYTVADEDKNRIMYAALPIQGSSVMFCDVPTGMALTKGDNISPVVSTKDMDEVRRLYNELQEGGNVIMEIQETFWSNLYGMVVDKFGITWQLMHDSGKY